jgi:hypothetical protein
MKGFCIAILVLVTIAAGGMAGMVTLFSKSAIHEIMAAVYGLTAVVAFAAAAILGQLHPPPK